MNEASRGVLILDPTITSKRSQDSRAAPLAPRLRSLDGATIGLLANSKTNAMAILDRVLENLRRTHDIPRAVRVEKPSASMPVADDDLEMMAERCQAVIAAIGD